MSDNDNAEYNRFISGKLGKRGGRTQEEAEDSSSMSSEDSLDKRLAEREAKRQRKKEKEKEVQEAVQRAASLSASQQLLSQQSQSVMPSLQAGLTPLLQQPSQSQFLPFVAVPPAAATAIQMASQVTQTASPVKVPASSRKKRPRKDGQPSKKREVKPLPPKLLPITYEHRDQLKIVEAEEKGMNIRMAYSFTTTDQFGVVKEWKLKDLLSDQLRQFAYNFGCTRIKIGSANKGYILSCIAKKHDLGNVYDRNDIPNPLSDQGDLKCNACFRIINAAFDDEFRPRLANSNDAKKRGDFELANKDGEVRAKSNPNDDELWREISEVVNNPMQNNRLCTVFDSGESGDKHLRYLVNQKKISLQDFSQGTFKTCQNHMRNMWKARAKILDSKRRSGNHQPDTWGYLNDKHLKFNDGTKVPGWPVYYLDYLCTLYPEFNAAYTQVMAPHLTSDSTGLPKDETKGSQKRELLGLMEQATKQIEFAATEGNKQRKRALQLQEEQATALKQEQETKLWEAYSSLYQRFEELQESGGSQKMILNLVRHLRDIEKKLEVPMDRSAVEEDVLPFETAERNEPEENKEEN